MKHPLSLSGRPQLPVLATVLFLELPFGCSSTAEPATGDVLIDLSSPDPRIRIQATDAAVQNQVLAALPELVKNLSDPDPAVRMFSALGLQKLTGANFGYKAYGSIGERENTIAEWRQWLEEHHEEG